jgi:hypothetical protein
MPFTVDTALSAHISDVSFPTLSGGLRKTSDASGKNCELDLSLNLDIPCMPLSVGLVAVANSGVRFSGIVSRVAGADDMCELRFSFGLSVPYMEVGDICLNLSVPPPMVSIGSAVSIPNFSAHGQFVHTDGKCELQMSYWIDFPAAKVDCAQLSVAPAIVNVPAAYPTVDIGVFEVGGRFSQIDGLSRCALILSYHIEPPRRSLAVGESFEIRLKTVVVGNKPIVTILGGYFNKQGAVPVPAATTDLELDMNKSKLYIYLEVIDGASVGSILVQDGGTRPYTTAGVWRKVLYEVSTDANGKPTVEWDRRHDFDLGSPI